jgi:dephospho-CoA kinase
MITLGLTGGMGMGKSTAAAVFRRARIPVFDADAAVHRLQARGGQALPAIAAAFPGTVTGGVLNRAKLRDAVLSNPAALHRLEAILHPLVRAQQRRFLARARAAGQPIAVLDIPLLFETGGDCLVDVVLVVSAPPDVQRARVHARRSMTNAQTAAVLAKQMPDAEKCARGDFVIKTGLSRFHATRAIRRLIIALRTIPT